MALEKYDTAQDALIALAKYLGEIYEKDCKKSHTVYFLDELRLASDKGSMDEEYILKYKGDKWVIEEE